MDAIDGISDVPINQWDTAVLTLPIHTPSRRMEDGAVTANDPTFTVADEKYLFIIIDHPIAFAFKAVALFPPRFAPCLGMKNSIVCTNNPAA